MASLTTEIAEILHTVQHPGDFYPTGTTDIFAPRLDVVGVGPIALPLLPVQAQQLIAIAEQAPYGWGEATLGNMAVRRTWQIDPEWVQIGGRHWEQTLADIVTRTTAGLGVTGPVVADLYKRLVYDPGSFFVNHRDTEKAAGMFATLLKWRAKWRLKSLPTTSLFVFSRVTTGLISRAPLRRPSSRYSKAIQDSFSYISLKAAIPPVPICASFITTV